MQIRWVRRLSVACLLAFGVLGCSPDATAETEHGIAPREPTPPARASEALLGRSVVRGRTYVPCYSHVYTSSGHPKDLAVTLSVRNVSPDHPVVLRSVRFFDTKGRPLDGLLEGPSALEPLQTAEFFIATKDRRGGSGANFMIEWAAEPGTPHPVSEAVMVRDDFGERSFAFVLRGIEVPYPSGGGASDGGGR